MTRRSDIHRKTYMPDVVEHDTNAYYAEQDDLEHRHRDCVSKIDVRLVIADTEIGMSDDMSEEDSRKLLRETLDSLEELVKE